MSGKIKKELDKGKEPIFCTDEALQEVKTPIAKAHYKLAIDRINENHNNLGEYIKCDICGKDYTKYNKSKHNKTNHHIFCTKINKKWRKMILDN